MAWQGCHGVACGVARGSARLCQGVGGAGALKGWLRPNLEGC